MAARALTLNASVGVVLMIDAAFRVEPASCLFPWLFFPQRSMVVVGSVRFFSEQGRPGYSNLLFGRKQSFMPFTR